MPDFSPVITLAYQRILGRSPDSSGLASWNENMNSGMTEAEMREALLRSPEYAEFHPDRAVRASFARAAKSGGRPRKRARGSRK
jgi:hypothetical protein